MNLQKAIQKCVLNHYFPEAWYALDNWLALCKGKNILEVGSGQGLFSVALTKAGWKVNSIDNNQASVQTTKVRLKKEGFPEACHLVNPKTLPFPNRSFDGVVSINFAEFQANPADIFQEVSRVLKPGGRAVFITLSPQSPWALEMVSKTLRAGKLTPLSESKIKEFISATDLKIEKTHHIAKYMPFAFSGKPLPWFKAGATVSFCTKTEFTQEVDFNSTQIHQ